MAFLPFIVALVMLLMLRQSSLRAGLATLAATLLIVVYDPTFSLPGTRIILATARGVGTSLTVLTILWPGFLLYHLTRQSGGLSIAARSLTRLCPDRDLQFLLLVLGLCPFIESVSGFGLGIVVIIPLLTELGCAAAQAALLALLGQLTATWGAMGVATLLGAQLSGLPAPLLGARSALLLAPVSVSFGLLALLIAGGNKAVQRSWLPAILAGGLMTLGEWALSQFPGVDLAGLLTALSIMALLTAWGSRSGSRMDRQRRLILVTPIPVYGGVSPVLNGVSPFPQKQAVQAPSSWRVLTPFLFLSCGLLLAHLLTTLSHVSLGLLASPGVWVAGAAGLSWPLLRITLQQGKTALERALRQFLPASAAITSFLVVSALMSTSGMTSAIGGTASALGRYFLWISPALAAFSGWMTGSVVGANAMFLLLQQTAAEQSHLPLAWIVAAQNAACSIGRMLSPPLLILAASTAQLAAGEGLLLRKMGPIVLAAVLVSCLTLVGISSETLIVPVLLLALFIFCCWLMPALLQAPAQAEQ